MSKYIDTVKLTKAIEDKGLALEAPEGMYK